jgi:hypothetical protein
VGGADTDRRRFWEERNHRKSGKKSVDEQMKVKKKKNLEK